MTKSVRPIMGDEAFLVLDAIGRGAPVEPASRERWLDALKTILWVVETDHGLVLTSEGHQARHEMALQRRKPIQP